jgi:hypothetical protein
MSDLKPEATIDLLVREYTATKKELLEHGGQIKALCQSLTGFVAAMQLDDASGAVASPQDASRFLAAFPHDLTVASLHFMITRYTELLDRRANQIVLLKRYGVDIRLDSEA